MSRFAGLSAALKSAGSKLKAGFVDPGVAGMGNHSLTRGLGPSFSMGDRLLHRSGQLGVGVGLGGLALGMLPIKSTLSGLQDVTYGMGLNTRSISGMPNTAGDRVRLTRQAHAARQMQLRRAEARQKKAQLLQRRMSQSMARLAAADPQLYQQVLTGRQLPQGAVVLGGAPRVDLMEELALRMATSPQAIPGAPAHPSVMDLI